MLSIREDAWAKLDRFEGHLPSLFANYVRAEHLRPEAASQAIERPVAEWNRRLPAEEQPYTVEQGLVGAVIEATAAGRLALAGGGDGATPETAGADAIEAPCSGRPLRHQTDHHVNGVAFSPDGRTLASGGDDGAVRLWEDVLWRSVAELHAQVCSLVVGTLTMGEWARYAPGLPDGTTCSS